MSDITDIDSESLSDSIILQDVTPQINEPEDNSQTKKHSKSLVYNYFTLNEINNRYNCNYCDKSYKVAKDGSISSLWKHIKSKHNDLFLEINQITEALNKLEISEQLVCIMYVSLFIILHYIIIILN
jgi:transposase-like protein